jgi:hypothetical protein
MVRILRSLFLFFLFFNIDIAFTQSLRINEFSQGANNNKEWVELVVTAGATSVGPGNCSKMKINLSGWIIDDNNGDFSPPNHFTGTGIAGGFLRFKNVSPWIHLPVGSIVVIYNASDKDTISSFPADDILDLNGDCVFVVPSNNSTIEYCTNAPTAVNCTTRTNYINGTIFTGVNWSSIGLANAGDAIQIRNPSFNLVQGVVYGKSTSATGCTTTPDMVGNSLAPLISNLGMSGLSASFNGTVDADIFGAGNWVIQSHTLATPGSFNNTNNKNYIENVIRGGCSCKTILPNGITLKGEKRGNYVDLSWNLTEWYSFDVEKKTDKTDWHKITSIYNTQKFTDNFPSNINYYRIRSNDGKYSNTIVVKFATNLNKTTKYYTLMGQEILNPLRLPPNSIYIEIVEDKIYKKINQ